MRDMLLKQRYGSFLQEQKTDFIYGRSRTSAPTVIQQPKLSQAAVCSSESLAETTIRQEQAPALQHFRNSRL